MNLLSILIFSYSLTLGYDPSTIFAYNNISAHAIQNGAAAPNTSLPLYVNLQGDVAIAPWGESGFQIFAGGGIRDDFYPVAWDNFDPWQDTFKFDAGLRWGPIELRYQHVCFHPVLPYSTVDFLDGAAVPVPHFEGSIDDFSITFSGKIGGGR